MNGAWPSAALGDLFEIAAGKTMSAAARHGAVKTPFLRTSNVLWDEIDLTTVDEMAIPEHELEGKLLRPGDLLVCEGGEIGRAAIWEGQREVMAFQNHLHRLRPKRSDIDPRFYVYFLQAGFTQLGIFEGAGNKTTIPNLSRNRLAALEVPKPTLEEQRALGTVLLMVSSAAKLHARMADAALSLKRMMARELFTRGLRGEAQKETEIGQVPGSWEVVSLGMVSRIGNGTTPNRKNPEYWNGGSIPWITSGRMYERHITDSDLHVTSSAVAENHLALLPAGTVLLAIVGQGKTLGHCAILGVEATVSRHVGFVRLDESSVVPGFLVGYLEYQYELLRQLAAGNGSTRGALTCGILRSLKIPLPPLSQQQEIVGVLDAIDKKIDLHRRKRATLDELFNSLLHKLMTGDIRVADLDLSALDSTTESAA